MYKAEIRLLSALPEFDRPYTYLSDIPVSVGDIAALPFGSSDRHQYGVVTSVSEYIGNEEYKRILFVLPEIYSLTSIQLGTAEFIAEQFFCTMGDALRLMLPTGLDIDTREYLVAGDKYFAIDEGEIKDAIDKTGRFYFNKDVTKKSVQRYLKEGVLHISTEAVCHVNEKKERFVRALSSPDDERLKGLKNKELYKRVLEHLQGVEEISAKAISETYSIGSAGLSTLAKRGLVELVEKSVERTPYNIPDTEKVIDIKLSDEQIAAYEKLEALLDSKKPAAALLYGVTGSGKTSVVLSLIDKAVEAGQGVIMLVPEIALTSQSAEVLFSRYKDKVAIIHSGMSKGERYDSWQAIKSGKKQIVLGTRSAIFAPVKNLGIIVIDEEQDDSFKSDMTPRYRTKDVARFICAKSSALMLLSSATPDVESFYSAKEGKYTLVTLEKRYGEATLPDIVISDLLTDSKASPERLIGEQLEDAIRNTLEKGEQAVIFVNRRGLRKLLTCRDCRTAVTCPNCSVPMTLHQKEGGYRLVCHYCGYHSDPPTVCPTCNSHNMQYRGYGTQKLEEELHRLFPSARVLRLDADSTRKKLSHDDIINDFALHRADILIGTQMVAKGHNFPDVTLVGVIMADLSLFSSDYRANEHTFALMTQVVGRAGRDKKKGRAILQTMNPYNEIIELCTTQNYEEFFKGEIALRRALIYPPFCSVAAFYLTGENEDDLDAASDKLEKVITQKLESDFSDVKIIAYGPFEAIPYKLKNTFRRKLVVKFKNNKRTRDLFRSILSEFNKKDRVRCFIDVSPTVL